MKYKLFLIIFLSLPFSVLVKDVLGQDRLQTTTIDEDFTDNRLRWTIVNDGTTKTSISNNEYLIGFTQKNTLFSQRIGLPSKMKNSLYGDEVQLSFDLRIDAVGHNNTSGIGFTFDHINSDYTIIYLGEEFGRMFSALIPKIKGRFRDALKDGESLNFVLGKTYRVLLAKKLDSYDLQIDGRSILSFIHEGNISFNNLYFTEGKYSISNLKVIKLDRQSADNGSYVEKVFDPDKYQMYILLAGIKTYPQYKPLNSPINDIKAMRDFWESPSGGKVPKGNIISLADDKATRQNITDGIRKLANKATPNDVLIIYLTGHGLKRGYFNCVDNLLLYSELNDMILRSNAKNKLVIVDACFSGYLGKFFPSSKSLTPQDTEYMFKYKISAAQNNTSYLMSCSDDEVSFDGPPGGNSVFTSALLQSLRNKANKYDGQVVTLSEIYVELVNYFKKWNEQNLHVEHVERYDTPEGPLFRQIIKQMHPQLLSSKSQNNLPFVIYTK